MRLALVSLSALTVACAGDLPSPAVLNSLRLLALVTPTPDVPPGTDVRVTALWYNPVPGRTLWFRWRLCPEPLSGDARDCALPGAGTDLTVETSGGVNIPGGLLSLPAGTASGDMVVYLSMCPGAPSVYDPAIGHAACASPEGIEAVRRIALHPSPPWNNNPGIASAWVGDGGSRFIFTDGGTPTLGHCVGSGCPAWTLGVQPAPGAAEALPGGGAETLEASYYSTLGTLDVPRAIGTAGSSAALTVHWTPPTGPSGQRVNFWVVLRDQRGGDTVATGSVTLP